jgi:hypothetical protein
MNPFDRDPGRRPDSSMDALGARLTGRGCDDLHGPAGLTTNAAEGGNAHFHGSAPGTVRGPSHGSSADTPKPRPGWYAYRVTGAAGLPWWAVEVALTIERPAAGMREDPAPEWWDSHDPGRVAGEAQALLLLRAPGRVRWLEGIAEAIAEVEAAAGVRSAALGVEWVAVAQGRRGPRLLSGPALPGLVPVTPAVAKAQLGAAGSRGLPAPLRRRRPAAQEAERSWRSTPGSVLTCEGPGGTSAQAVVALYGQGNVAAIAPPPGGALVLRAWRARGGWGVACGLVLGAAAALGLGREAGRVGARARAEGWNAVVLSGSIAVQLARAGSPALPAPEAAAHAATGAQVTALFEACLAAGGLGHQATGSYWRLAVTP